MKKSQRMKVVLDQAERKEAEAMEVLAQARKYRDAQNGQLLNLQNYHKQYMHEMTPQVGGIASVGQLQSNLQFINQIDLAIAQQEKMLESAEKSFQYALAQWKDLHQKKKGLSDLIDRIKYEEQIQADKQEQKLIEDMHAARAFRRK